MKKLLITGFDPFGGESVNPSWEAVKRLPNTVGEYQLYKLQIPTVFGVASKKVLNMAAEIKPDLILCIGQAGGRAAVTPERIAVNIRDARIPDNAGNQPQGESVEPNGPAAYFTTVPVNNMVEYICALQLPATVSNRAGAFVCNDTLYALLHHFNGSNTQVGFIHIPYLPQQGTPSLPLEDTVKALIAAINAC